MAMASEMRWHPDPLGMFSTKKNLHPPTSVAFPDIDILHPALLSTPPRTMCLYNYWIAYVRQVSYAKLCYAMPHHRPQGEVLEANCVKIQPAWMGEMADLLGPLQVPGGRGTGDTWSPAPLPLPARQPQRRGLQQVHLLHRCWGERGCSN